MIVRVSVSQMGDASSSVFRSVAGHIRQSKAVGDGGAVSPSCAELQPLVDTRMRGLRGGGAMGGAARAGGSSVDHGADHPLSLYAATKRANELMAHSYSHLQRLRATGLRLLTVYGPWGRPDMALSLFARRIVEGRPIDVFNRGRHRRDFVYVDDAVEVLLRSVDRPAAADGDWSAQAPDPASSAAPHRIHDVGSGRAVSFERYIEVLERCLGRKAVRMVHPLPGDVEDSHADVGGLAAALGYVPETPFEAGVECFVDWYRAYHGPRRGGGHGSASER